MATMVSDSRPADHAQFPVLEKRTKEESHAIESFKVPDFTPAYPVLRNPGAAKAIADHCAWFEQQSLPAVFVNEKELQCFLKGRVYDLPVMVFAAATEEGLLWVMNYIVWLFLADDELEKFGLCYTPEKADSLFLELNLVAMWSFPDDPVLQDNLEEFLDLSPDEDQKRATKEYVKGKLDEARLHPDTFYDTSKLGAICTSFGNLWETLVTSAPKQTSLRWGRQFQQYLIGVILEFKNKYHRIIPSLADYIDLRRKSSGVGTCSVIVEYVDNVIVPEDLYNSPEMQAFLLALNDVVAWHNDIFSFKKETRGGDVHNLIFVIRHERQSSFSNAGVTAFQLFQNRLQDLDQAMVNLERITPPESKEAISQYRKLARCWVSGMHEFITASKRYD